MLLRAHMALRAYFRLGKCASFFFCFNVFNEASCYNHFYEHHKTGNQAKELTRVKRRLIARVFFGRRSSGRYFFDL